MPDEIEYREYAAYGGYTIVFNSYEPSSAAQYCCLDNAGCQSCAPGFRLARQDYNTLLLMATLSGSGKLLLDGHTYSITPESVMFLDCRVPHSYYTTSQEPWRNIWMHFTGGTSWAFHAQLCAGGGPMLTPGRAAIRMIADAIRALIRQKQDQELMFDILASQAINVALHELALHCLAPAAGTEQSYVNEAIDFVRANYRNDITLGDIADAVHLSKYYFSKQFKELTGFSPYDYLIRYRIAQSKSLLATTREPVAAVARMVGFNSATNFISAFRQYENTTPLQYRKNMRV